MITNILFVGIGGALGAISRFGVNEIFENYFTSSAGTLVVNIIGCFFIGIFVGLSLPVKDSTYYFFVIGFLGSFTTMSAFTYQTMVMANTNLINAVSYIMLTVILSILATYVGAMISK
jgi:CrcB protein|tara:strand:+ start:313 stop:666 length:354 start_codon:yes stop_codon:yes gene_type:complete